MKKITKKLSTLLLSLAACALISSLTGVTAQAEPFVEQKLIYYMQGNNLSGGVISILDLAESDVIHKDSVTSSKPAVASIDSLDTTAFTNTYNYYADNTESSFNFSNASIYFTIRKAGTSVISFKINDTTYKTKVKVYKYTNPIKTLKITGIKNGKNQASKFKKKTDTNVTLKKNVSSPILSIAAKKNWKITSVNINEFSKENLTPIASYNTNFPNGKNSVNLRLATLKAKNSYDIVIELTNKKTSGTITCMYRINMN